ncbi:MAG: lytic murein transglycosylase [Mesorhizobium sp.]|nr:MAG: lytic murein transglycosylase [Mesorhizobium sp.]RWC67478.1 MAG: lytic murein transglycosylase [Mesorhizobium sp.]
MGASIPLCPAGHLPLKEGDWMARLLSPVSNVAKRAARPELLISPLEGEMAGRPEGGERPHRVVSSQ